MKTRATMLNRSSRGFKKAARSWPLHKTVLVEGDSWFKYTGSNLYVSVLKRMPMVSLAMSGNGDTVVNMTTDKNLDRIESYLRKFQFDYLFFSGGGNDIVNSLGNLGNQVATLDAIGRGYDKLINLRNRVSPGTEIVTHNYGQPNLRKGGFSMLGGLIKVGPWIVPKMKAAGVDDIWIMDRIIGRLMDQFYNLLLDRAGEISIADTKSVIQKEDWRDEMHLTSEGYDKAAEAFFG